MSDNTTGQAISDWVISHLRTAVPLAWGPLVTWVLAQWEWLKNFLENIRVDLNSPTVIGFVTVVVTYLWYALWRVVQKKWGAKVTWLSRIFLGSSAVPSYTYEQKAAA